MAAYIKIDGIDGEVTEKAHDKWIEVHSVNLGVTKSGGGAAGSVRNQGSAIFHDVRVSKTFDKSSPKIMELTAKGVRKKVNIHLCTTTEKGQQTYLAYELENCVISSYDANGGSQDRPSETLTLNFTKISCTYNPVDVGGAKGSNVEFKWDVDKDETY